MEEQLAFLVVDDAPIFRELGTLFLSRGGRVLTAARGEDALEIVRRERPDVVILDFYLPDLEGELVCREIRTAPATSETAVIAVVGRSSEEHALAIRAGACDVLSKPLSRRTLVQAARRFTPEVPRGLPRVPLAAPVRVVSNGTELWGTVRNLSRGGMFIETDWNPPAEAEMRLEFALPEGPIPFSPTAKLIWHRSHENGFPKGMGVRFLALDRKSALSFESFVYEHFVEAPYAPTPAGSPVQ